MSDESVPQIEMTPDASRVVDEPLLRLLRSLDRRDLVELSRVVTELHTEVVLSTGETELDALRQAPDAPDYEWRAIDGEVVLTLPTADGTSTRLGLGLTEQVRAAPTRWRHDVASALLTLVADLEDAARRRRRRLVLGLVAAGVGAAGLLRLGLFTGVWRAGR